VFASKGFFKKSLQKKIKVLRKFIKINKNKKITKNTNLKNKS